MRRLGAPLVIGLVVLTTAWISLTSVHSAEDAHRAAHASAAIRAELNNIGLLVNADRAGDASRPTQINSTSQRLEHELATIIKAIDPDESQQLRDGVRAFESAVAMIVAGEPAEAQEWMSDGRFAALANETRAVEARLTELAEKSSRRAGQALVGSSLFAAAFILATTITEGRFRSRRSVQEARAEVTARYQSLIEHSPVHIYVVDDDGAIDFMSSSAIDEVGYEVAHVDTLLDLIDPVDRQRVEDGMDPNNASFGEPIRAQVGPDGRWFDIQASDHQENPTIGGVVVHVSDATATNELETGLRKQARQDELTGLPNRRALNETLARALARRARNDGVTALLILDLDGFKGINDTLGHPVGDRLLKAIAERLQQLTRSNEQVARLGGDEFALVLDLPEEESIARAETAALRLIRSIQQPFEILGQPMSIDASVGIAMSAVQVDSSEMLRQADIALYEAKRAGGSRAHLFAPEMEDLLLVRLQLKQGLEQALRNDEFTLAYQPIVSVAERSSIGFEALMRWQNDGLGSVSPAVFIPAAEESGAIIPLGRWALRRAIEQLVEWQQIFDNDRITMSVNASVVELVEADYSDYLASLLKESGLYPASLQIEVTESAFAHSHQRLIDTLTRIRQLGVTIALDDFGTGYSSMGQLQMLPVDCLKIDRSFIEAITTDDRSASVVRVLVELGEALGLTTVAEGVETPDQFEALVVAECDFAQGYLLARPMPASEVPAFMALNDAARTVTSSSPHDSTASERPALALES